MLARLTVASLALMFTAPAFAGECPADKVGVDVTPPGPTAPSGLTDTTLASYDLAPFNIPGGRAFRMRRLEVPPGGIIPWHSHAARPGIAYVVSGRMTEYRSTCSVPIEHGPGEAVAEEAGVSHWWRNNSRRPAVLIATDILPAPQ